MPPTLVPWDPITELGELRSRLDRTVNAWFDDRVWMPAIDVKRDDDNLVVDVDAPGVKPGDVKIEVQDGILTISGVQEEHKEKQEKDYLRRERRYGSFSRSLALPAGVDVSKIKATTKDGVVEVTVPLPSAAKHETVTITPTAS